MVSTDSAALQREQQMLPDDVFRDRLERTLVDLEAWADGMRDCAEIDIAASPRYWRMSVAPHIAGGCPFELMINSDQTFDLRLASEVYENKPLDRFDFFVKLANAIAAGRVERNETRNALTGVLLAIGMRVEIQDGWDWTGVRRVTPVPLPALEADEERSTHRFLSYRR
jgi:hypothetical protein